MFILYVMNLSHKQESIATTCDASDACYHLNREFYVDEACQQLYTDPRAWILQRPTEPGRTQYIGLKSPKSR